MAIIDLYSKRQKRLRGEVPDVYVYNKLPTEFRVQVVHIWDDALGKPRQVSPSVDRLFRQMTELICREYGVFTLSESGEQNDPYELTNFFLKTKEVEKAIDVLEITFRGIDNVAREHTYMERTNASKIADAAISELNSRFREHGLGYQYSDGEIIRVDSEMLHAEAVKPALRLLNQTQYAGAQEEFLKAYEHYRSGNSKEALNECLKSFESLMKGICDKRGWAYKAGATAKELIQVCMDNDLIPSFWQAQYASLRSLLESSVPTGRNKLSGHGQGVAPTSVPDYLVGYMLHMTASAVVFLAEAEKALP